MNFNKHSTLEGQHAVFSASQPGWLGKTAEENWSRYISSWKPTIGTVTHAFAKTMISNRIKLSKNDLKMYKVYLLDNSITRIPQHAIQGIDMQHIFSNLMPYVNDAIGFRMTPEQVLCYSNLYFGTADAISFDNGMLRIHDLKTGVIKAKMEQLLTYSALFCLEYKTKPADISIELRIYQNGEVLFYNPTYEDILPIMNQIQSQNKIFEQWLQ